MILVKNIVVDSVLTGLLFTLAVACALNIIRLVKGMIHYVIHYEETPEE